MCRRHFIEVLIAIAATLAMWGTWWLLFRSHAAGKVFGAITAAWVLIRVDPECLSGILRAALGRKGAIVDVIEKYVADFIASKFGVTDPAAVAALEARVPSLVTNLTATAKDIIAIVDVLRTKKASA